jgi:hypothetical protein
LNFEDEYEEEDSYGRSVEDDPEMSPTMAQFMYRRGDDDRSRSLSSFMRPECKPEANKFPVAAATEATPLEDGRLAEAVKQVQDVLGDTINLATVKQALLQYDYDVARATDRILSDQDFEKQKPALVAAIQATTDDKHSDNANKQNRKLNKELPLDVALSLEACQSFLDSQVATGDNLQWSCSGTSGQLPPISYFLGGSRKAQPCPQNQTEKKSGFDFKRSMEIVSNRPANTTLPFPSLESLAYAFEVESKNTKRQGHSWCGDPKPSSFSCAKRSGSATQSENIKFPGEGLDLPSLASLAADFDSLAGNQIGAEQAKGGGLLPKNQLNKRGMSDFNRSSEVSSSEGLEHSKMGIDVAGPSLSQLADSFEKSSDNPFKMESTPVSYTSEMRLGTVSESSAISSDNPLNLSSRSAMSTVTNQPRLSKVTKQDCVHGTTTDDLGMGLAAVTLESLSSSFEKSTDNPFSSKPVKGGSLRAVGMPFANLTDKQSDANYAAQSASSMFSPTHFLVAGNTDSFESLLKPSGCTERNTAMSLSQLADQFENSSDYLTDLYQNTALDSGPSLASLARLYEDSPENPFHCSESQACEPSSMTVHSNKKQAQSENTKVLPVSTDHGQLSLSDLSYDFGISTDSPLPCISAKPGCETDLKDREKKSQLSSGNVVTDMNFTESVRNVMSTTDDLSFSGHATILSDDMEVHEEQEMRSSLTRAKPSLFARILCTPPYNRDDIQTEVPGVSVPSGDITPFDFSTPSPDDVVLNKQQQAQKKATKQRSQKK